MLMKEYKTYDDDPSKIWTVEEFLQLEESKTPCELIHGKVFMSPAPAPFHQIVLGNFYEILRREAKKNGGTAFFAPVDLYIDDTNVFQPDLMYISAAKQGIITERGIKGVPDLIVEIISPSNVYIDRTVKKKRYLDMGVSEYWLLSPTKKWLKIYTPETGEDTPKVEFFKEGQVASEVLTGLKFDLEILFEL